MKILLKITLLLTFLFTSCLAEDIDGKVKFVIDDKFRGVFCLYEDNKNGQDANVPENDFLKIIKLEKNRLVPLQSIDFLNKWSRYSYEFKNGKLIANGDLVDLNENQVGFYSLGVDSQGRYLYFIGNQKDHLKISKLTFIQIFEYVNK